MLKLNRTHYGHRRNNSCGLNWSPYPLKGRAHDVERRERREPKPEIGEPEEPPEVRLRKSTANLIRRIVSHV